MQTIHEGTSVYTADGEKVGSVDQLVIDPGRRRITHVVVGKGVLFPEQRVLPVSAVADADRDAVRLEPSVDPADLPLFQETHYVRLDPDATAAVRPDIGSALSWAHPVAPSAAAYPPHPGFPGAVADAPGARAHGGPVVAVEEEHLPTGTSAVGPGSTVVTTDGEEIGDVRQAVVSDDGRIASISVDPGWFRQEREIPGHMIDTVDGDRVLLAVGSSTVRQLDEAPS